MIFRVNEKEKEKILKKINKSKLNQNEYLLKCALDKEIHVIDGLHELTIELKRVGDNLAQLTRAVNEGNADCFRELELIQKDLNETWQSLRELIQKQLKEEL